jgi:hypothetical protein
MFSTIKNIFNSTGIIKIAIMLGILMGNFLFIAMEDISNAHFDINKEEFFQEENNKNTEKQKKTKSLSKNKQRGKKSQKVLITMTMTIILTPISIYAGIYIYKKRQKLKPRISSKPILQEPITPSHHKDNPQYTLPSNNQYTPKPQEITIHYSADNHQKNIDAMPGNDTFTTYTDILTPSSQGHITDTSCTHSTATDNMVLPNGLTPDYTNCHSETINVRYSVLMDINGKMKDNIPYNDEVETFTDINEAHGAYTMQF